MGVHRSIVGDGSTLADDELAAVVEHHEFVNGAIIFDREVVTETELDPVEDLYVLADVFEDVLGQHLAKAKTEPVIQSQRRAIEHLPEVNQRLALAILLHVDVAVILGFKGYVSRV